MKKALSFAVALGLVAGLASVASAADLSIGGDARWRGVYMQNADDATDHFDGVAGDTLAAQGQDTYQGMDQRYRFNADLKINDDVKINTRIVLADDVFGNALQSEQTPVPGTEGNGLNHYVDRANMSIKTLGGTWSIGRMDASWGNKFMGWGASVDRIKAAYKFGDLTVVGYLQKNLEDNTSVKGDGDKDTWGALVVGKAGDTTWGVIANYNTSDTDTAKGPASATNAAAGKDTGYLADAYFTTKIGAANLLGEIFYSGGDLGENEAEDPILGGFVGASMDLSPVTVKGLFAIWDGNDGGTGGRDCDNDFAPTLLIGTCNETAIVDFGATTNGGKDQTWLLTGGVDFKASEKLTLGALVGYFMATDKDGYCTTAGCEEDAVMYEFDLTASYALAQNATYNFGVAYGDVNKFSEKDDAIFVVGNRVEVKW